MKTRKIILTIIILSSVIITNAQPLPPTAPSGNPVPIEGIVALLLASVAGLGIVKLKRKRK